MKTVMAKTHEIVTEGSCKGPVSIFKVPNLIFPTNILIKIYQERLKAAVVKGASKFKNLISNLAYHCGKRVTLIKISRFRNFSDPTSPVFEHAQISLLKVKSNRCT